MEMYKSAVFQLQHLGTLSVVRYVANPLPHCVQQPLITTLSHYQTFSGSLLGTHLLAKTDMGTM